MKETHMMTSHITKRTREIHDCVSNWQDILVRLYLGRKHQERLQYAENALKQVAHCFDMSHPQTLGELCLENVDQAISYFGPILPTGYPGDYVSIVFLSSEANKLRTAMYHKHRDPEIEVWEQAHDYYSNLWQDPEKPGTP